MTTVQERLAARLAAFPEAGRSQLAGLLGDPGFRGLVPAEAATEIAQALDRGVEDLMRLLVPFAQCYAIAPVSGFQVGVVARGTSGSLYFGANMEYVGTSLALTVHGEQSATANAWLHGERGLSSIAISAAPCGLCRQFLYELTTAATLVVLVGGQRPAPLRDLLPQAFGPADLGVAAALMSPESHGLALDPEPEDPLVLAALAAADSSYAPYSGGFAGVAIETASGAVYAGRYAESAAFNPSLSPLQCALVLHSFGGNPGDAVARAVLVEASSKADHAAVTSDFLSALSDAELEAYRARPPGKEPIV